MADEIQRLIMEVVNGDRIKELNALLKDEADKVRLVKEELDSGRITQAAYEAATRRVGQAMLTLKTELNSLQKETRGYAQAAQQFSYVLDDLVNTSGGWERKLSAISNNIPGFVSSLTGSMGIAGAVGIVSTALIALAPLAKAAWEALAGEDQAEDAKERIREVRKEIEEAHKEFEKLANAPTDAEKQSAEGIRLYLQQRPNADRSRAAVAAGLSGSEVLEGMAPDARKSAEDLFNRGNARDEDLRTRAAQQAAIDYATAGGEGPTPPHMVQSRYEELVRQRQQARDAAKVAMDQARSSAAERVIKGAVTPGPAGFLDRERLLRITQGRPGFEELQGYRPEAIQAAEDEYQRGLPEFEEIERSGKELARALKKRRKAEEDQRAMEAQGRKNDRAMVRRLEREREQAEQQEARALERDDAQNLRDYEKAKKTAPFRRARRQVTDAAQAMGYGTPTDHQADDMARQVISLTAEGTPTDEAIRAAVQAKAQEIERRLARPMLREQVARASRAMGYGTPTDTQADQMAQQVLSLTAQGVSTNDAILAAVQAKAQEIERLRGRLMEQQQRAMQLQMGGDQGGQFSMMPGAF